MQFINDGRGKNVFGIQYDNCIIIPTVAPTMAILFLPFFDSATGSPLPRTTKNPCGATRLWGNAFSRSLMLLFTVEWKSMDSEPNFDQHAWLAVLSSTLNRFERLKYFTENRFLSKINYHYKRIFLICPF